MGKILIFQKRNIVFCFSLFSKKTSVWEFDDHRCSVGLALVQFLYTNILRFVELMFSNELPFF